MKRGGYDSYGSDEVLNRARERGENVGWERLFRAAGTAAESLWLVALAVLAVAAAWLIGGTFHTIDLLTLTLIVIVVAALIAARVAGWLVAPYGQAIFRRSMWALSAAALFVLLIQVGVGIAELVQLLVVGSRGADPAGLRAFNVIATLVGLLAPHPCGVSTRCGRGCARGRRRRLARRAGGGAGCRSGSRWP